MKFVVSAGDMFWTGTNWSWSLDDALVIPDLSSADVVRDSFVVNTTFADLICVRAYLQSFQQNS